jgi:hypothetical protein
MTPSPDSPAVQAHPQQPGYPLPRKAFKCRQAHLLHEPVKVTEGATMERWQFIQSPNGDWYWLCSDVLSHRTRTSAATFKTESQCIADAMDHGYRKAGAPGRHMKAKRTPRNERRKGGWR